MFEAEEESTCRAFPCKLAKPTANEMFHAELEKELNAWVQANVASSERRDRGLDGLQREFAGAEAKTCVAKHNKRQGCRDRQHSE